MSVGDQSTSVGQPSICAGEPSIPVGDPSTSVVDPLPSCVDRGVPIIGSPMSVEGSGAQIPDPLPDIDGSTTTPIAPATPNEGSSLAERVSGLRIVEPSQDSVEPSQDVGGRLPENIDPGMRIVDSPVKTVEPPMKTIEPPMKTRDGLGFARAPATYRRGGTRRVVVRVPCVEAPASTIVEDGRLYT